MKKFNLEKLRGKRIVVNLTTKKEVKAFVKWAVSLGISKISTSYWGDYKENTCFEIDNELVAWYADKEYFEEKGYKIISFEEALESKKDKETKLVLKKAELGKNEVLEQLNILQEYVKQNFDVLYKAALRTEEANLEGNWKEIIRCRNVGISENRITSSAGWHVYSYCSEEFKEEHLIAAFNAVEFLAKEASKKVKCNFKIRIEEDNNIRR